MNKRVYSSETVRQLLADNGLENFNSLWGLELDWYEPPNFRRNGWSGVAQYTLAGPDGIDVPVFLKRQFNHRYRPVHHPIRGIPTLYREFRNIQLFNRLGISTADPLYYGETRDGNNSMAILIIRGLEDYVSLDRWVPENHAGIGTSDDKNVIDNIARLLGELHRHRIQHGCLYAKHIFIKTGEDIATSWRDVRLIDLEKTRRRASRTAAAIHDLDQLFRHAPDWFIQSHARFFSTYSPGSGAALWKKLSRKWSRNPPTRRPQGVDLSPRR